MIEAPIADKIGEKTKLPGQYLILGADSLVGSSLVQYAGFQSELYAAGRKNFWFATPYMRGFRQTDLTKPDEVITAVESFPGRYVVNFAAETNVDEIEKNRPRDFSPDTLKENLAFRVNSKGVENLVRACKLTDKKLIHFSTDFVFDGKSGPYNETDLVAQSAGDITWYGWTKLMAEEMILDSNIDHLIIRIAYPYRREFSHKTDFARGLLKLYDDYINGRRPNIYPIFTDQTMTPTLIDDLTPAIKFLIEENACGIYHIASPLQISPYEFYCELLRVARKVVEPETLIPKGSIREFQQNNPLAAKRPVNGGLATAKLESLGYKPSSWIEGINFSFNS